MFDYFRVARHPPRTLSMSDLAIMRESRPETRPYCTRTFGRKPSISIAHKRTHGPLAITASSILDSSRGPHRQLFLRRITHGICSSHRSCRQSISGTEPKASRFKRVIPAPPVTLNSERHVNSQFLEALPVSDVFDQIESELEPKR